MRSQLTDQMIVKAVKAHVNAKVPLQVAYEIAMMKSTEELQALKIKPDQGLKAFEIIHIEKKKDPPKKKRKSTGGGRPPIRIEIDGIVYGSSAKAQKALKVSKGKVRQWLKTGKDKRLQGEDDAGQRNAAKDTEAGA